MYEKYLYDAHNSSGNVERGAQGLYHCPAKRKEVLVYP